MQSFTHQEIFPGIYQITDSLGFCCILIIGNEQAILYDTCSGVGNLRLYVETLTTLPVTVLLSHSHFDHIGGSLLYPAARISLYDMKDVSLQLRHGERLFRALTSDKDETEPFFSSHHGVAPKLLPWRESDVFELGSMTLTSLALPGHTAGSMGLYCEKYQVLFTGDAITPIMCLFFPNSLTIDDYIATLHKLEQFSFTHFVTNHHTKLFKKEELPRYLACAEFSKNDSGMKFQHDLLTEYTGRLHIYSGENSEADDFLALISKPPV